MQQFLPLPHHSHIFVVDDEDLDRQPVLHGGRHFLHVHQHRGLAGDVDDQRIGMRQLHADRGRQAVAHGAEAARGHPAVGLLELQELRRPHLVLAHFGGDVVVAVLDVVIEPLERVLRLDRLVVLLVGEAVARPPAVDLAPPRLQRLEIGARLPGLPHPDQLLQRVAGIAHDRQIDPHVLVDRAGIDIDVDLLGMGRELGKLAGDAIVEARADIDQHVAVIHRQVGFVGAVHAQHAEELLVRRGKRAESHQGVGDGIAGHVDELGEQLGRLRPGIDHAAAGVEDRLLGIGDQLDGLLDLRMLGLDLRTVALVLHRFVGRHIVVLVHQHVLGQVDHDRPRSARARDVEGLVDRACEIGDRLHEIIVLGAGPRDARRVRLLEGVIADQMGRHLAGQADHGDGIHQRVGEPGHGVGGARTGRHKHHAHLAGRARIAFRGMDGRLLVAHQDMA